MIVKSPSERSVWPSGPLTDTQPGEVSIDAAPKVLHVEQLILDAGPSHMVAADPEAVDVIVWQGIRFLREDRR